MVVTVAEEGNQRKGGMTEAESEQCVNDVLAWFKRSADLEIEAAEEEEVQPIEKAAGSSLDTTLSYLLTTCSAGIWFGDKMGMTASNIVDTCAVEDFSGGIPFAACVDDEFYLVVHESKYPQPTNIKPFASTNFPLHSIPPLASTGGEVREWTQDDGYGETFADSFKDYLEEYRNALLGGKYEFVEDCGCMEKAGGSGGGCRK